MQATPNQNQNQNPNPPSVKAAVREYLAAYVGKRAHGVNWHTLRGAAQRNRKTARRVIFGGLLNIFIRKGFNTVDAGRAARRALRVLWRAARVAQNRARYPRNHARWSVRVALSEGDTLELGARGINKQFQPNEIKLSRIGKIVCTDKSVQYDPAQKRRENRRIAMGKRGAKRGGAKRGGAKRGGAKRGGVAKRPTWRALLAARRAERERMRVTKTVVVTIPGALRAYFRAAPVRYSIDSGYVVCTPKLGARGDYTTVLGIADYLKLKMLMSDFSKGQASQAPTESPAQLPIIEPRIVPARGIVRSRRDGIFGYKCSEPIGRVTLPALERRVIDRFAPALAHVVINERESAEIRERLNYSTVGLSDDSAPSAGFSVMSAPRVRVWGTVAKMLVGGKRKREFLPLGVKGKNI